jgi:hypothetical protein
MVSSRVCLASPVWVLYQATVVHFGQVATLIEALDDTYSGLHKLLDDETFGALGDLLVDAHPSVHRLIRWYGGELADFLVRCPTGRQLSRQRDHCRHGKLRAPVI